MQGGAIGCLEGDVGWSGDCEASGEGSEHRVHHSDRPVQGLQGRCGHDPLEAVRRPWRMGTAPDRSQVDKTQTAAM